MVIVKGRDEPGVGRHLHRVDGDLTVLADGLPAMMTADEEVHDLGDVLAALPDDLGPLLDHASRGHIVHGLTTAYLTTRGRGYVSTPAATDPASTRSSC